MSLLVCEDVWHAIVPTIAALKGARALIVPSASPARGLDGDGELESVRRWEELLRAYASEHGVYIFYAGLAGFEGGKGMTGVVAHRRSARRDAGRGARARRVRATRRHRLRRGRHRTG
jgi:predicted amidohydrolase